jgi:hypothetical protein
MANDPPWQPLYDFEAATWEEAMSIHNLRQGFGPYMPAGEPEDCPVCGVPYYPDGSGVCWRGHGSDSAEEDARGSPQSGNT